MWECRTSSPHFQAHFNLSHQIALTEERCPLGQMNRKVVGILGRSKRFFISCIGVAKNEPDENLSMSRPILIMSALIES
jgi:hypothetical protein